MNKILVLILAIGFSCSLYGADNRSAPNIFSSGSTISSSQMNENFNFLASKARVKTVNCDSGETIADAINEGFNYLKISGTCDGGIMVYNFDPSPFGMSISDLPNKPVSHLIIKGVDANRGAKIVKGSMNSNVMKNSYLQLIDLTFNDKIYVNNESSLELFNVKYEVLIDGTSLELEASRNSHLTIENSSIHGRVGVGNNSSLDFENSTLNCDPNSWTCLSLSNNSSGELDNISFYNGENLNETINVSMKSSLYIENLDLSGTIRVSQGSALDADNINIDCTTSNTQMGCMWVDYHSFLSLGDSNVTSLSSPSLSIQWNSMGYLQNANISRSDGNTPHVELGGLSSVQINGDAHSINVSCFDLSLARDQSDSNPSSLNPSCVHNN